MLKATTVFICMALTLCTSSMLNAGFDCGTNDCERIKDGTIFTSEGEVLETGFDAWGYNYQSRQFVGGYCDAYKDAAWCQSISDDILYMKWNDAWLSNKDCDGDGALDRHYGHESYIGSGATLINVQKRTSEDENKNVIRETSFTKIKAAPYFAYLEEDIWYKSNGKVLGPALWNDFYVAREYYRVQTSPPSPPEGLTVQSMSKMSTTETKTAASTHLIDPFNVDFDQFTPQD